MLLYPMFCLNFTILNSFAEKKLIFFVLFQIFSAKPGFSEYFLRTRFAESTTFSTSDTGCPTKHDLHGFCLISLATNMLESWDIIHWKGGIHSFVWSTKTFLYDIREPRYKQIKMGYRISKCLNIGQS